ncbi:MAG: segregation/condensation protein A [Candidatus Cyclonatronum sp.]|uniref:segregation and condensation protein A n=1 Tax=Cyclonatronum sp. TaxID=3024185 RepID=UPI0025C23D62|nr:segregation/condensation protein A [Cyclonatronum sp.]MCC5935073.1 segregation/condensation protein A [Balneolales bacterium]MCH8487048.1 segregation/condensation protein A [Cyclonatronum sp.]
MYRVALQNFEGPLDLLLFFIRRDELDIKDIPISRITDQFMEYLSVLDELDLEVASEFILMAGTLMAIKARMLLPRPEFEEDELPEHDPRYELIQSLLEYKRYKEMGVEFRELESEASKEYFRGNLAPDQVSVPQSGEALRDVTMIDLMAAIKEVFLRKNMEEPVHQVDRPETSIEEMAERILLHLHRNGRTSFITLCEDADSAMYVVVTFLSVLEMVKEGQLHLFISEENQFDFYVDIPRIDAGNNFQQILELI